MVRRYPMRFSSHPYRMTAIGLLAALTGALVPGLLAAGAPVRFVQIRIAGPGGRAVIDMPAQLLEYLAEHSKDDVDVGLMRGEAVRFPMADLIKVVQGDKARDREILFFSGKDDKGQIQQFYVKTYSRKSAGESKKPTKLIFAVREGGDEKVSLKISIGSVESFAKDFGSGEKEKERAEDFGPFVRSCLASAKALGPGLVLRIQGDEGELLFSLE
jgi:hypothetical protein